MIGKIDHIGVAVSGIDQALVFWEQALGATLQGVETVESEQVKVAFLRAGESTIELLEPTSDTSAIARHLAKRGSGLHHLTLEVDDIHAVLDRLTRHGIQIVGDAPRVGAGGRKVAFVHPASTGGVLLELVDNAADPAAAAQPGPFGPGSPVLLYLRDPTEKVWGVLRKLDASGVIVEGLDLSSFDDWMAQVDRREQTIVGPSVLFLPMLRVDKILLDRVSGGLPSLADRFASRVGRTVQQVMADDGDWPA